MFLVPYSKQVRSRNGTWKNEEVKIGVKEHALLRDAIWFLRRCWHARDRYVPGIIDDVGKILYLPVYPGLTKRGLKSYARTLRFELEKITGKELRDFEVRFFRPAPRDIRVEETGGELEDIRRRYPDTR